MPVYQCNDCGKTFKRKDALREHTEDCTASGGNTVFEDVQSQVSGINLSFSPRRIRSMFTLRNFGLAFGVLMMATLFLGTASFMSSTAPGSGPTGAVTAESNPALGYSIRSNNDVPNLPASQRPDYINNQPLTTKQQLWTITSGGQNGPAAIIHYNCDTQCPGLVNNLSALAQNYQGWVYVAPNPEIGTRIAVTGFQRIQRYDSFQPQQMSGFICAVLQYQPIACVGTPGQGQNQQSSDTAAAGNETGQDTPQTGQ